MLYGPDNQHTIVQYIRYDLLVCQNLKRDHYRIKRYFTIFLILSQKVSEMSFAYLPVDKIQIFRQTCLGGGLSKQSFYHLTLQSTKSLCTDSVHPLTQIVIHLVSSPARPVSASVVRCSFSILLPCQLSSHTLLSHWLLVCTCTAECNHPSPRSYKLPQSVWLNWFCTLQLQFGLRDD